MTPSFSGNTDPSKSHYSVSSDGSIHKITSLENDTFTEMYLEKFCVQMNIKGTTYTSNELEVRQQPKDKEPDLISDVYTAEDISFDLTKRNGGGYILFYNYRYEIFNALIPPITSNTIMITITIKAPSNITNIQGCNKQATLPDGKTIWMYQSNINTNPDKTIGIYGGGWSVFTNGTNLTNDSFTEDSFTVSLTTTLPNPSRGKRYTFNDKSEDRLVPKNKITISCSNFEVQSSDNSVFVECIFTTDEPLPIDFFVDFYVKDDRKGKIYFFNTFDTTKSLAKLSTSTSTTYSGRIQVNSSQEIPSGFSVDARKDDVSITLKGFSSELTADTSSLIKFTCIK